jgi:hypothetical protein
VAWVVGGTTFFTVVVGRGAGRPAVVVVARRVVGGVNDVVEGPGTVVAGPVVVVVDELVDVAVSAAIRMARPLSAPSGKPAMTTPRPAQTTTRAAAPARFAAAPCRSTAPA